MTKRSKGREQYKRLLNFMAALVIILFFMLSFSHVWYNYYNSKMHDPFWYYGNLLMMGIYAVMYAIMTSLFNGFRLGYSKFMGLFGSQVLGIVGTNALEIVLIALIGRNRMDLTPMFVLAAIQLAFALPWSYVFTLIYTKMYPPRKLIIIYGNSNAKYLVNKMAQRTDKYNICAAVSCEESLDEIEKRILRYEGVIITEANW